MRIYSLYICLLAASCYNPELPSGHFVCDSNSDCPTQQICSKQRCVTPAPPPDLSTSSIDPTVDMAVDPCKDGWVQLATDIFACRRNFAGNGSWTGLCRTGFHACDGRDAARLTAAGPAVTSACAAAGGFFAARLDVGVSNTNNGQADGNCSGGSSHGILGCGGDSKLVTLRTGPCSGLTRAALCSNGGEPSGWSCSGQSGIGNTVTYSGGGGGLLCCKD